MKKFAALAAVATAFSFSVVSAEANGWRSNTTSNHNGNNYSSGLVNVSPTVRTGNLNVLSGIGILNNSPILSGNNLGLGILGSGTGLLNNVIAVPESNGRRGHRR